MSDGVIDSAARQPGGVLGWIERNGNRLPDPVILFFGLIAVLVAVSVVCDLLGVSAAHPVNVDADGNPVRIEAVSLLSAENLQRLWVQMPVTFTHFHPLGYVLVVMLGAGVAERSGLFAAAMRSAVRKAPVSLLTPVVALVAMIGNHAADAGYVVLIPLAGILYATAGRHPLAGIAAAFAGVSGGFSANISPGQLDALLIGITQEGIDGSGLAPGYQASIAGNWYFIAVMMFLYLPLIWFVTDRIIEPRLGRWRAEGSDQAAYASGGEADAPLTEGQKRGLVRAGWSVLFVAGLWALMTLMPGTPLMNDEACAAAQAALADAGAGANLTQLEFQAATACEIHTQLRPFYVSLVAAFFVLFLLAGWSYGDSAGTINTQKDLVDMMSEAMKDMGYYLVLAFAAAHFVAMFNWSELGIISAIHGAAGIQATGLGIAPVMGLMVLFTGLLNLVVGSASAKWALLAPVLVPMLMLLGVSPEGATAAYRVGDSATNIITPLMVYFPLILVFCQRWDKNFGLGSLTAMMVPYSVFLLISGIVLMVAWVYLGLPLGPGVEVGFTLPGAAAP